jgi:hypothetical protein
MTNFMDNNAVEVLQRDGIFVYGPLFTRDLMIAFREQLDSSPVYGAHVSAKATEPPTTLNDAIHVKPWPTFAPPMAALVKSPFWLETAMSFFKIARAYFDGEFPRLYSMNAFWTKQVDGPAYVDTQAWHRDGDDRKQLTIFMLGSDVPEPSEGAHLYQRGTHRIPDDKLERNFRDAPPVGITEVVYGEAGTLFLVDTGGLHKAIKPASRPRLLVWARYGVSNPPASYGWDSLSPVPRAEIGDRYPSDLDMQESIRLVVS